ncbi:2 iron 2 sulfur cluster binding protein [Rutstroemia sp. NJR-2017a BVV2]|nr:2 iron 2 sulfur cluster binding protein [Rutstroemia sp. NJR-2017a BVV2]
MHISALTLTLLLSSSSALQIPSLFSPPEPFYAPFHLDLSSSDPSTTDNSTLTPSSPEENTSPARGPDHADLRKRATTTTLTRNSCPTSYSPCATHAAACCPTSAVCSTDSRHNIACCAIGASCTGTVATPSTTRTTGATQTGQFVSNPYFPFPILPTSYSNEAACASATDSCAKNYALCTVDLEGGMGGGVTVSAPNGGVTVAASSPSGG